MSDIANIPVPNEAPSWASVLVRNISHVIQTIRRGPQALTGYANASPPTATNAKMALAYDTTNDVPWFSTKAGVWKDLVPSSAALTNLLNTAASGTWTPTLTNSANITSSTAMQCQYSRLGSVVTFSGGVGVVPTLLSTLTTMGLSLPITSNFSASQNLGGAADSASATSASAAMFADVSNKRATFQMLSVGTSAETYYFSCSYLVI